VLKPGRRGVAVNGWGGSMLSRISTHLAALSKPRKRRNKRVSAEARDGQTRSRGSRRGGTYVHKSNADWLREQLNGRVPFEIYPWRSVGTRFTRALVHEKTGGRLLLRFIYWLEERFPRFLGEEGQYPIIVIKKPGTGAPV
jgi:hypothetical protein